MDTPKKELVTNKPATQEVLSRLIQAHINDDVYLSEDDKIIYERLVAADELLKDYTIASNKKRAEKLQEQFGISIRSAYNDLQQAAKFFNQAEPLDPATGAQILIAQLDKLLALCLEKPSKNYLKDATNILKLKKEVYTDLCKGTQLDPRLLQQNTIIIGTGSAFARELGIRSDWDMEELMRILNEENLTPEERKKLFRDLPATIEDAEIISEQSTGDLPVD